VPDRSQQHDDEQRPATADAAQTATAAHGVDENRDASREAARPAPAEEIQRLRHEDQAALEQRWPELQELAEHALKRDFGEIAEKADDARRAVEDVARQVEGAGQDRMDDARRMIDEEMRGARRDVLEARQAAWEGTREVPAEVEQRMDERYDRLAALEETFTQRAAELPDGQRRESVLTDRRLDDADLKRELWELSGRELQNRELSDFRRRQGLPDESVVFREDEQRMVAADVSLKRVMDNVRKLTAEEAQDTGASAREGESQRVLSDEEQQRLQRSDGAALAQRWPELTPAAENRLKEAFRGMSEQADRTREALAVAEREADPDVPRLQSLRRLVDDEMRLARRDVVDAREKAEGADGRLSREARERLEAREQRLSRIERDLNAETGESGRRYLENAGLAPAVDRHRELLKDEVSLQRQEMFRAEANREVNPSEYDVARERWRAASQELRDLDALLATHVPSMRPDLVEARIEERRDEERLRIDITDFTHRLNSVDHTIKAHIYREAMQRAFPEAEVSMFEYRSPSENTMVDSADEFAVRLNRVLEAREAELRTRRDERG